MATSTLNIPLTGDLKAYVEARVDSGAAGTPNDYVRELIRDDRDRRMAHLEEQLVEAMKGAPIEVTDDEWESPDLIEILRSKLEHAR